MTVVLSMNRFCSPISSEGGPEIAEYQKAWASQRQKKSSNSLSHLHAQHQEHRPCDSPAEPHYRGISNPVTTSKITYFKRKHLEEEDCHRPLGNCSHKNVSIFEERAHVLYMSLEKLKFIDDPEVFLRRSVLINNLMKRIHGEILLQNNWCFPACSLGGPPVSQEWFVPQDCPYRKRLRVAKEEHGGPQTCCFYQDCGSHYINIPFSVSTNGDNVAGSSSSTSPLPGSSHHMDFSTGETAFYRNGVQVPSCGGFVTHGPRHQGNSQKANIPDDSPKEEKKGVLAFGYDVTNGGSTPERKGRFYDFLATGCNDKGSVSEPWKKSIRKKEVNPGNALCCSKGSKM